MDSDFCNRTLDAPRRVWTIVSWQQRSYRFLSAGKQWVLQNRRIRSTRATVDRFWWVDYHLYLEDRKSALSPSWKAVFPSFWKSHCNPWYWHASDQQTSPLNSSPSNKVVVKFLSWKSPIFQNTVIWGPILKLFTEGWKKFVTVKVTVNPYRQTFGEWLEGDFPETFFKNFFCCIVTSLRISRKISYLTW